MCEYKCKTRTQLKLHLAYEHNTDNYDTMPVRQKPILYFAFLRFLRTYIQRRMPLECPDNALDMATGRKPISTFDLPLEHTDNDLDMAMDREPPLENADCDLDMAIGREPS